MIKETILSSDAIKTSLKIVPYQEKDADIWDEFVGKAPMSTFLHSRRYLSYHGTKFQDISLKIEDDKNRLIGLFLAAVDTVNSLRVVSHPGITYGGLLHQGNLRGEKMLQAFQAVSDFYRKEGFEILRYKAIPSIYFQAPLADDLYALFRLGATRYRCDLSCAIELENRLPMSQRRQRGVKKANKSGIEIRKDVSFAKDFWMILEYNLKSKYGVGPVHSLEEIIYLHSLFPNHIDFVVAVIKNEVIAGTVLFNTPQVIHTQYIASTSVGYETSALDLLLEYCIRQAKKQQKKYFNFGISTEQEGHYLNEGLYQFKLEFGGGGVLHEFYDLIIKS